MNSILSPIDYKILALINKKESISIDDLYEKFSRIDEIDFRLRNLVKLTYIREVITRNGYGRFVHSEKTGQYYITEKGKTALRNYQLSRKESHKNFWFKNIYVPIIVAFVTTLLTNYILPTLLRLLKSFFDFLSKSF